MTTSWRPMGMQQLESFDSGVVMSLELTAGGCYGGLTALQPARLRGVSGTPPLVHLL
jgi:hypothetical protein